MNKNFQKVLVALRSGEYKQCTGQLKKGNSFCVLGVLCDVFLQDEQNKNTCKWSKNDYFVFFGTKDQLISIHESIIPEEVRKFFGITFSQMEEIFGKNDFRKYTFNQIADYMEELEF